MESAQVEDIMKRARAGAAGKVTAAECAFLKSNLGPADEFPTFCSQLLKTASRNGILPRRNSRVAQTWKIGEHGVNRLRPTEKVSGGAVDDVNPAEAESTHDIYMRSQTPEQQEKIRRLQVRAASRGARPRVNYTQWTGRPENQEAVHTEVRKDLVRRASRRSEMLSKKKDRTEIVA